MSSKYTLISVAESATPPICSSCHRPMKPGEVGVAFPCPNCGQVIIRRCKSCRRASVPYRCPNCGFEGP